MKKKSEPLTWSEVDLKAVAHNLKEIRRCAMRNEFFIPTRRVSLRRETIATHVLAVVKSNAYGHGMAQVSKLLDKNGVGFFGVSNVFEGIELRNTIKKKPILVFESTLSSYINELIEYRLTPTVGTLDFAHNLNAAAKKKNCVIDIHVKVDTGMGRLGVWVEEGFDFIASLYQFLNLRITGIYTHFPVADTDRKFTLKQVKDLYNLVKRLDEQGFVIPLVHAANSMGLAGYETKVLNLARPGLMLYGCYPSKRLMKEITLKPALSVYSKVIFLKNVEPGRSISYGRTFVAKKKMRIAVIPVGYNDGYLRALSNKAHVVIKGKRCPVVGNVTMNQIMVDVTALLDLTIGTKVTILGSVGKLKVTADELAKSASTINYEIICSLGNSISAHQ